MLDNFTFNTRPYYLPFHTVPALKNRSRSARDAPGCAEKPKPAQGRVYPNYRKPRIMNLYHVWNRMELKRPLLIFSQSSTLFCVVTRRKVSRQLSVRSLGRQTEFGRELFSYVHEYRYCFNIHPTTPYKGKSTHSYMKRGSPQHSWQKDKS